MIARLGAVVCLGLSLAGCYAPAGPGRSQNDRELYRQIEAAVLDEDKLAAPQCTDRKIDKVELLKSALPADLSLSSGDEAVVADRQMTREDWQGRGTGVLRERWTVLRCGERKVYRVTVEPDPTGGRMISVRPSS